jgi:hypothetical protein
MMDGGRNGSILYCRTRGLDSFMNRDRLAVCNDVSRSSVRKGMAAYLNDWRGTWPLRVGDGSIDGKGRRPRGALSARVALGRGGRGSPFGERPKAEMVVVEGREASSQRARYLCGAFVCSLFAPLRCFLPADTDR